MPDILTYRYAALSTLLKASASETLFLSNYSEIEKKQSVCFFWGRLNAPFITARCLVTLSNVVQSSFNLSPADIARLKDPIVTAGNNRLRFEGFSQCAGVYGRVDILPGGYEGEFPENGTTNVDFNQPMITALSRISKHDPVLLSIGEKEVALQQASGKITERKVPLPVKWIKGLASVQVFLSQSEKQFSFTRVQALQLFQSIPTGKPKTDYYLIVRGNKPMFSPVSTLNGMSVGGIQRLKLLEPLLAYADELRVFPHSGMQSTTWQLYFGPVRFSLTLSKDMWRGFSGEGAALESLIDDVPDAWIDAVDKYSYANQAFNPVLIAAEEGLDLQKLDAITARLSAIGLLGYDVDDNQFFYRRLPFKLSRLLSLNPRLKAAEKLLAENKVDIISQIATRTEARVAGSGVTHTVVLDGEQERCTCTWFSRHQGERGLCKHMLAVKKKINPANPLC